MILPIRRGNPAIAWIDTRSVSPGLILKARVMSVFTDRNLISATPGYWAVQIRLRDGMGEGRRYLCHAENDPAAADMAARLMGSDMDVRGFDTFWIDEALLEEARESLPPTGRYQNVSSGEEWSQLLAVHTASESARPELRRM